MPHPFESVIDQFSVADNQTGQFFSLPRLAESGKNINRLPYSIRVILESAVRSCDEKKITQAHVDTLLNWQAQAERQQEVPFVVSRVILQDYTGIPLLVDLMAMRDQAAREGADPKCIEPLVPVDLVIDHSVQTNITNNPDALQLNMKLEFERNKERYEFLKFGAQAFNALKVIPPGVGIVHQINLEHIAKGVFEKEGVYYPDTVIGTDSHTTMINGVGVVGWGVGGIEAEASMLGQPIYILEPDVIGIRLTGKLREGVNTTDLVLTLTEMLREENVVGKFVEYFGDGVSTLSVPERGTIANMAPDYGATMGLFSVDQKTLDYYRYTGRADEQVQAIENYYRAQGLFAPDHEAMEYTKVLELNLSDVAPCVSGPKRPQDRVPLFDLKKHFNQLITAPTAEGGYAKSGMTQTDTLTDGDILIAGITSCTNTSNPSVLLAAGLLAKKAVERGLSVDPKIKTSLAPGSRVVTAYLERSGLQDALDQLGFYTAGYGCTTCIGNVGDLDSALEQVIQTEDVVAAAVLSGNRNFEARIHPNIRANFLMSPPLVVAFAIAGTVRVNLSEDPLGQDKAGKPVFLKDIWPTDEEIHQFLAMGQDPETYRKLYSDFSNVNEAWNALPEEKGAVYPWNTTSTYVADPPFFDGFTQKIPHISDIKGARALALLGDSITTDHISPAGRISTDSPAGHYLESHGIESAAFNSYGARRGNHEVMMRGTFSNVRLKNLMLAGKEGGFTAYQPGGEELPIYDAAMAYQANHVPTIVFAGEEYGTGSSRDWAAKGTLLLGVKAVVAKSYERIHRSNLIGMGVLPCQFMDSEGIETLQLDGTEEFDLLGVDQVAHEKILTLIIKRQDGTETKTTLLSRLDTDIEIDYFRHGGILPYTLRQLLAPQQSKSDE